MRDVAGKEMKVGDKVAVTTVGYAELSLRIVVGFSPKKIRIRNHKGETETRYPYQVAIIS
jgi:hypothetical protein